MATTVTSTRETVVRSKKGLGFDASGARSGNGSGGPNGNGPGGGGGGPDKGARRHSPDRYRIGIRVGLASIMMMFTALSSAYIVRAGTSNDWRPIALPSLVWLSTALILASSVTFETARRSLKRGQEQAYRHRLFLTLLLGLGFLAVQLLTWRQLVAQGIYLATNPHSSFFYVLTGLHGLHLLGGILALNYLLFRVGRQNHDREQEAKRQTVTDVVALYWHFMDGLWIYLLLLLFLWR